MVWPSVQYCHNDLPTTSLAVWAHVSPANTMRYSLLLDHAVSCDSNHAPTPFARLALPSTALGEYTLQHHDIYGTAAYLPDPPASLEQLQLSLDQEAAASRTRINFLGSTLFTRVALRYWPALPSLLRNCSSRTDATSYRFPGVTKLEPGYLMSSSSAPLVQASVSTFGNHRVTPSNNLKGRDRFLTGNLR